MAFHLTRNSGRSAPVLQQWSYRNVVLHRTTSLPRGRAGHRHHTDGGHHHHHPGRHPAGAAMSSTKQMLVMLTIGDDDLGILPLDLAVVEASKIAAERGCKVCVTRPPTGSSASSTDDAAIPRAAFIKRAAKIGLWPARSSRGRHQVPRRSVLLQCSQPAAVNKGAVKPLIDGPRQDGRSSF
jgi:hypothetical protein